jgi:hypothetical protein
MAIGTVDTPHAITRYGLMHLPSSSFVTYSRGTTAKLRLYKSLQKAQRGLHLLCKMTNKTLYLENQDTIEFSNYYAKAMMSGFYRQFEPVKMFTLVSFVGGDKLLHVYVPFDKNSEFSLHRLADGNAITKDSIYFKQHPERILLHEHQ